ncbi:hypothetical protein Hanom_Chr03g00255561 [Helianthus anomalus]
MVQRREMNLACMLAWSFTQVKRGGHRAALDMGPYITRLAENWGLFRKYKAEHLTPGPRMAFFGLRRCSRQASLL